VNPVVEQLLHQFRLDVEALLRADPMIPATDAVCDVAAEWSRLARLPLAEQVRARDHGLMREFLRAEHNVDV